MNHFTPVILSTFCVLKQQKRINPSRNFTFYLVFILNLKNIMYFYGVFRKKLNILIAQSLC